MNQKIEDLRRKAFVLYGGQEGIDRVNWEVVNAGVDEDRITAKMEKYLLNKIIKNVFIEYVGLDRAKQILATEVAHIHGYQSGKSAKGKFSKIRILERVNFIRIMVIAIIIGFFSLIGFVIWYTSSFDPVDSCREKTTEVSADSCFIQVALARNNLTLCDEIMDIQKKYNCYSAIGVKTNNTEICGFIPYSDPELQAKQDRCYMCLAFQTSSFRTCKLIKNYVKQAECESQIERGRSLIC